MTLTIIWDFTRDRYRAYQLNSGVDWAIIAVFKYSITSGRNVRDALPVSHFGYSKWRDE